MHVSNVLSQTMVLRPLNAGIFKDGTNPNSYSLIGQDGGGPTPAIASPTN